MRGCQILDYLHALRDSTAAAGAECAASLIMRGAAAADCLAKSSAEAAGGGGRGRGLAAELWQVNQILPSHSSKSKQTQFIKTFYTFTLYSSLIFSSYVG